MRNVAHAANVDYLPSRRPESPRGCALCGTGDRALGWDLLAPTQTTRKSYTDTKGEVSHGLQLQFLWMIPTAAVS